MRKFDGNLLDKKWDDWTGFVPYNSSSLYLVGP